MDLIPKPGQVVAAASNVAQSVFYGGVADLRPMPRTLIDDGELREVYHYRPEEKVAESGDPVLLVTPLAAPSLAFDLRRGCSLVEHLVGLGRRTYLVEYGQVSFRNRSLGMEHWIDEVLPAAIRAVSEHAGGRPVHVIGWSLGGIFAMLTAADQPDLPIASLTVLGSPVDVKKVPLVAPMRPLLNYTQGRGIVTRAYRALGGIPQPLVSWVFSAVSVQKIITKPLAVATHLDDTEFLAQLEAVDRFTSNMSAYPGRAFGQLYHRMLKDNALATGSMTFGDRIITLASITAPVLIFAGASDGIAPIGAVRPAVALLTGAEEVQFEIVPGGHLGMLTGRAARGSTWTVIEDWIQQWSSPEVRRTTKATAKKSPAKSPAEKAAPSKATTKNTTPKKAAPKPATAKKVATKKTTAKQAAAKKSPAKKAAPKKATAKQASSETIGSNPDRRYDSTRSRSLGR